MKLVSGNSNKPLAEEVAKYLGVKLEFLKRNLMAGLLKITFGKPI